MHSVLRFFSPVLGFTFILALSTGEFLSLSAAEFLRLDFNAQTLGDPVQTDSATTPFPLTKPYLIGGYPEGNPVPPFTGTATVASPAGMSKAAVLSTTQGGIGANFMDTQFLVVNDRITLAFNLNILDVPTTGLPQVVGGAPNGQAFVINTFGMNSMPNWRFVATPTSASGGNFAMRNNTNGDLIAFASYLEGQVYNLAITSDFTTNAVDVSLNGVSVLQNHPFINAVSGGGLSEFFFFQNGVEGQLNQVALDNIVATASAIPEPSSIALLGLGLAGLGIATLRRRVR